MRMAVIAAAAICAAIPAAAQQSQPQNQQPQNQQSQAQNASKAQSQVQTELRQSLSKAGFQDIRIVDASYLIHATTADGKFTVMYIDPPSETTGAGADKAAPARHAMNQSAVRQALEKAGFKDVKIVDAAFTVRAKTADGSAAVMSINPADADMNRNASGSKSSK